MTEEKVYPVALRPQELDAVYAISQVIAQAEEIDSILNQITRILRPVFIFDNIALYEQSSEGQLEPTYARAIGRGRFREADLAWGEYTASDAFQAQHTVIRIEELSGADQDRTKTRYSLGLPLRISGQLKAVLVFIRFGGPAFTSDQINLAEFIATHIAQFLEHRQLIEKVASLEAKRQLDNLQDEFIAMISHELLTPLGFIKGYATTLMREDITWDDATRREFLSIIDEEADRLRELIDNLLDSSRLKAGTLRMSLQPTRIDTLVKEIALKSQSFHKNLDIRVENAETPITISVDPTRLAQVLENIINNAIKYAPGSPITITTALKGDHLRISIKDEGPGIKPEHLDKIFQRFYRVPDKQSATRGSGLGLYICSKIIEAHGGQIEVQSEYGKGCIFHIYLPVQAKP